MPLVTPGLTHKFVLNKLRELKYPYRKDQFITPGYIAEADLPVLFALCRTFLFPSLSEGFGMPIIEAQAIGRPVITSNIGAMQEVAQQSAILVDPASPAQIKEAIVRLTSDKAYYDKIVADGLKNSAPYEANNIAAQYLSIYKELAGE